MHTLNSSSTLPEQKTLSCLQVEQKLALQRLALQELLQDADQVVGFSRRLRAMAPPAEH